MVVDQTLSRLSLMVFGEQPDWEGEEAGGHVELLSDSKAAQPDGLPDVEASPPVY